MAITLSVYGDGIPMLNEIQKAHIGVAKESLSVAGNHMRVAARASFKASKKTGWSFRNKSGHKQLIYNPRQSRAAGVRHDSKTGQTKNPSNIANFINSVLMEKSMKVVVGGKNKTQRVKTYREGIPTGYMKVPGIGGDTFEILKKMNEGGVKELSKKQQNLLKNTEVMVLVKGKLVAKKIFMNMDWSEVEYERRSFMSKGFFKARPQIEHSMTKRYEKLLKRRVDKIETKELKIS